ncbi:CheR family methyltransferase [Pseudaquabacterium rugosum]|jgi:chemotaxis protein methyltransferase CheR|uniref:CheR family methyltransferase n=1 Tax=Pseudaquabacterium rugosum TaxID=2984194 RepID=A0ABU9BDC5_9BURK
MVSGPPSGLDADAGHTEAAALDRLIHLLLQHRHVDFRGYARGSLLRRARQACLALDCADLDALCQDLLRVPGTFERLMPVMTVQVSDLFRDPAYYRALRRELLPWLATFPSAKLWVAGCGHGEEVWSLAILLREAGLLDRTLIYATDICGSALERAQARRYPLERLPHYTGQYHAAGGTAALSAHYAIVGEALEFDAALAGSVVFAEHSLATDAVFSEVQAVSCRNVMIYFDRPLQDRATGLFADALVHGGFLGLGHRESLRFGRHEGRFRVLADPDPAARLYRRACSLESCA